MAVTVRAITQPATFKRYAATAAPTRTSQDSYRFCGVSSDRLTVFSRNGSGLYQSTDDGTTWSLVHTFPFGVGGMCETRNGECLVAVGGNAALYLSSGWSVNRTTATWTSVLTAKGGSFVPNWVLKPGNFGSNGVIVMNEYGAQTSAGNDAGDSGAARRVYLSEDHGVTWRMIFDICTSGTIQYGKGLHIHSSCYHETDNRIYVTYGDGTGQGGSVGPANSFEACYSDDRGATWQWIMGTQSTDWGGGQYTNILCTDNNLILQTDGQQYGLTTIKRTGYRTLGQQHTVNMFTSVNPATVIGQDLWQHGTGTDRPILATANWTGSGQNIRNRLLMSADGGDTWAEVWRNTDLPYLNFGELNVYGPTASGKIVGWENWNNGGAWANGAKFVLPVAIVNG